MATNMKKIGLIVLYIMVSISRHGKMTFMTKYNDQI